MANKRITDVDFVDSLNSNESFFINQNNAIKQINKENVVFGVANGGTGATTVDEARANLGAISMENVTVQLTPDGWTDNRQIVSVNGVTANNMVIVSPDSATDNYSAYTECNVRCVTQAEGILTFLCGEVPSITLYINVAVFS